MIRYSFIIVFWNLDPALLQRMLDSIPHRDDVEILLLDNASDDLDKRHFPGLDNPNTRIIFQDERKTVGYCRNRLIEMAQGEWIICADADDRFVTEELNRVMDSEAKEGYDLVFWGLQMLYTNGTVSDDSLGYEGTEIQPLTNLTFLMAHRFESPRKMARRQLLMDHPEIRFDDMPIYEDVAYGIQLLLNAERIGIYPPMVYQYIRRDTSTLCKKWQTEVIMDVTLHVFRLMDLLKRHGYSILEQEITKECLIRIKHSSKWYFLRTLFLELRLYGWRLFYRDLVGACFETYETNLFKATINYLRVKVGALVYKQ